MNLTYKERRLAYELSKTDDIARAATGSELSIAQAQTLLENPEFFAIVEGDRSAAHASDMETAERIIARYANIANCDPGEFFQGGEMGFEPKPLDQLTKAQRQCIKKLKPSQHGTEIEFHCPMRANDKLAEAKKLFVETETSESADEKAGRIRDLIAGIDSATSGAVTTH